MPMTYTSNHQHGNEFMAFIQTADMLNLYKRNGDETGAGVLITFLSHKNDLKSKYDCNLFLFSGIDREVGNIIVYGIGLCSNNS